MAVISTTIEGSSPATNTDPTGAVIAILRPAAPSTDEANRHTVAIRLDGPGLTFAVPIDRPALHLGRLILTGDCGIFIVINHLQLAFLVIGHSKQTVLTGGAGPVRDARKDSSPEGTRNSGLTRIRTLPAVIHCRRILQ
jgi:hypothetical protein